MIIQEQISANGSNFTYTYSNIHHKIRQVETGLLYDEAYDLVQYPMTYVETDELIEDDEIDNGNSED